MSGVESYLRDPALIWFIVGLILLLAEMATPGLVILFFGIGAWIVAIVCLFKPISINAQLIIFIFSSAVVLVVLRNTFKTLFLGHTRDIQNPKKDLTDFVGQRVIVKVAIKAGQVGKVEMNGVLWSAESSQDIAEGETAEVIAKDNLTLKVKK